MLQGGHPICCFERGLLACSAVRDLLSLEKPYTNRNEDGLELGSVREAVVLLSLHAIPKLPELTVWLSIGQSTPANKC